RLLNSRGYAEPIRPIKSRTRADIPTTRLHCTLGISLLSHDRLSVVQMPSRLATPPTIQQRYSIQEGAISWSGRLARNVLKRRRRTGRSRKRITIEIHQITVMAACETL